MLFIPGMGYDILLRALQSNLVIYDSAIHFLSR
jgi:hypothetical protein